MRRLARERRHMMDRLSEALVAARDIAVEEREKEYGPYCSKLEGYGDLVRKLEKSRASMKDCGRALEKFAAHMDDNDLKLVNDLLVGLEVSAAAAMYDVTKLYAGIRALMAQVKEQHGGDLLDMLEEPEDEAE